MINCPDDCPRAYRPAVRTLLAEVGDKREQRRVFNVLGKYAAFCQGKRIDFNLNPDLLREFRSLLADAVSKATAGSQFRYLYRIGIAGTDCETRDWLFENEVDRRSKEAVFSAPWWPDLARVIAPEAIATRNFDGQLVLAELDNYFRFRQRVPELVRGDVIGRLFLTEGLSDARKYHRMEKLVVGLEFVDPRSAELAVLREEMLALYRLAFRPAGRCSAPRRIPEVEALLAPLRNSTRRRKGKALAEDTLKNYRQSLHSLHDVLAAQGSDFALDRAALDIYVDHVVDRHKLFLDGSQTGNPASAATCATMLRGLVRFADGKHLQSDLREVVTYFDWQASLEPKSKARKLADRPVTLDNYFVRAGELLSAAMDESRINSRAPKFVVAGLAAMLVFYPLRRADVRTFRIGVDIFRTPLGWQIGAGETQKTGSSIEPIRLPAEVTPFLDGALLRGMGEEHLWAEYRRRQGMPLFPSRKSGEPYDPSSLTNLFKKQTGFNFGSHILRTLWVDELVADGADRETISAILQHRHRMTQKEYEVFAEKIRLRKAILHVARLAERALE